MKIREVLKDKDSQVATVEASETLATAIQRFGSSKVRALVVMEADEMVGVLAIRDVLARIDQRGPSAIGERVREAMTREVISVEPDSSLEEAHLIFVSRSINHLPVVDGGRLIGLVTPFDVLGRHVEDLDQQRELLHAYITNAVL